MSETVTRFDPKSRFVGAFIPAPLMKFSGISAGAKLIYARLVQYSSDGLCWAAQETIAEEVGMSKRGVVYAIEQLISAGFLTKFKAENNDVLKHKSCSYEFLAHPIFDDAQKRTSGSAKIAPSEVQKLHSAYIGSEKRTLKDESPQPPKGGPSLPCGPLKSAKDLKPEELVPPGELSAFLRSLRFKTASKSHLSGDLAHDPPD